MNEVTPLGGLRASLLDQRRRTESQIGDLTRNFDEIVEAVAMSNNDDEHDPEGTTIAFERAQVASLLNQARADLDAIDQALRRFDDGSYGACCACGQPISTERLGAIPAATKCIDCA